MNYRESHKSPGYGEGYHRGFEEHASLRGIYWRLEKLILLEILERYALGGRLLDFATGTGRIANFLSSKFHSILVVDVSESMLQRMSVLDSWISHKTPKIPRIFQIALRS